MSDSSSEGAPSEEPAPQEPSQDAQKQMFEGMGLGWRKKKPRTRHHYTHDSKTAIKKLRKQLRRLPQREGEYFVAANSFQEKLAVDSTGKADLIRHCQSRHLPIGKVTTMVNCTRQRRCEEEAQLFHTELTTLCLPDEISRDSLVLID